MKKKALITGISGQDGSFLAESLYSKGYIIHGVDISFSQLPLKIKDKMSGEHEIDLSKPNCLRRLLLEVKPDEIYHLAAYQFSSQNDGNLVMPFESFNSINLMAAYEILDTIKRDLVNCKFFYASSSHIFGQVDYWPQDELTPYRPDTLYAITKAAGNELCKFYREYHDVYVSVGICYNHESPKRPLSFITSQIAEAAAKASLGIKVNMQIRDLEAVVDWGAAEDYVNAMWLSLQPSKSDVYIISSGIPRKVSDFAEIAFNHVGLNMMDFIFQEDNFKRVKNVPLVGDPSKIMNKCNWVPQISFKTLVEEMVDSQIYRLKNLDNFQ